jgi:hypothetical protein
MIGKELNQSDIQRMVIRMNELQEQTNDSINSLNALYKERIESLGQPVSLKDKLSALTEIDEAFAKMEERQLNREKNFLENLTKMEKEHIEIGKQMRDLK